MKKIVSAILASAIVASPVFAQQAGNTTQTGYTANSNFVSDTAGRPTEFVYQGRTYYQLSNPAIILNTVGTTTSAVGTAVTSTAVASTAAAAPAAAASAGFAGGNIVGYVLGAAVLAGALSAATTSNH